MSAPSPGASPHQPSNSVERHYSLSFALKHASLYLRSLFPVLSWIGRYNSTCIASDLIAGVTVGAIVVPQGMAYASLAKLDPEFGLYSSFVGVMIYWLFGTSKDISIGPVAVLSTVVGNLVHEVNSTDPDVSPYAVAASLSVLTGGIVLFMGLLRCGWIVNLVSAPSLAAFMTGSAITIIVSQLPSILGLTDFSNRESPFRVVINIVSTVGQADSNAVLGLSALMLLYLARFSFTSAADRSPKHRQTFQLLNSMRAVSVIIIYTLISWLVHWKIAGEPMFDVLGTIPQGTIRVDRDLCHDLTLMKASNILDHRR
jgi:sodium-independent sulfate anion transporter 11